MKKIYLYAAALAMAMTACSQDESINVNEVQTYTLEAEITQESDVNSRINIGAQEENDKGKFYHRVNWEASDKFCAFNLTGGFKSRITFSLKEGETESFVNQFIADKPLGNQDILYAVYPNKRFKGFDKAKKLVKLGLPQDQNMSESQDAVMIGKYDSDPQVNKMKFVQTMAMLEIVLPESLKPKECIQVKASNPIAAAVNDAVITIKDSKDGFSGAVEILKGLQTITLYNNVGDNVTKVYCAIPIGSYTSIEVSKGAYTGTVGTDVQVTDGSINLLKTVKAKDAATPFKLQKKLYVIDCTK